MVWEVPDRGAEKVLADEILFPQDFMEFGGAEDGRGGFRY